MSFFRGYSLDYAHNHHSIMQFQQSWFSLSFPLMSLLSCLSVSIIFSSLASNNSYLDCCNLGDKKGFFFLKNHLWCIWWHAYCWRLNPGHHAYLLLLSYTRSPGSNWIFFLPQDSFSLLSLSLIFSGLQFLSFLSLSAFLSSLQLFAQS